MEPPSNPGRFTEAMAKRFGPILLPPYKEESAAFLRTHCPAREISQAANPLPPEVRLWAGSNRVSMPS